jgi:U2-associated protein SR140
LSARAQIREREAANPEYACLQDSKSAEGVYYRWKVWSLCMGDKERKWRHAPFQMTHQGPFYVPPAVPPKGDGSDSDSDDEGWRERERERRKQREAMRKERYKYMTGAQMEKARERQEREAKEAKSGGSSGGVNSSSSSSSSVPKGRPLSDEQYDAFEGLLRTLTASRAKVAEAMALALDCAESSGDVVELLQGSLLVTETPINVKVARLYLLSDVLHNSAAPVPHASTYRTRLQDALPQVSLA